MARFSSSRFREYRRYGRNNERSNRINRCFPEYSRQKETPELIFNGRYYLFLIHSKRDRWRRVEACFVADSLLGEFIGGDIFDDDLGFRNSGIAQGGIVEGPENVWNAILFQDRGAVGRIPVFIPLKLTEGILSFGSDWIILPGADSGFL